MRPNMSSRIQEMTACCVLSFDNTDVHLGISNKTFVMQLHYLTDCWQLTSPPALGCFPCFAFQMQSWIILPQFIWVTEWRWSNDCKRAAHHVVTSWFKIKEIHNMTIGCIFFLYLFIYFFWAVWNILDISIILRSLLVLPV